VKGSAVGAPGESYGQRSTSQDILLRTERGPLSILVWAGRPMHIDSTWEDVFAARERIGATFATE
jgi:GH43 family beta-xylosidase